MGTPRCSQHDPKLLACAIAVVVLIVGCSRGGGRHAAPTTTNVAPSTTSVTTRTAVRFDTQQRAAQACKKAAPHDLYSSSPTTVGAIHSITGGPRPGANP